VFFIQGRSTPPRARALSFHLASPQQRWLSSAALPLGILLAFADAPASAQGQQQQLNPVTVAPANPRSNAANPGDASRGIPKRAKRTARQPAPTPLPPTQPVVSTEAVATPPGSNNFVVPTPLNGNLVATSASRLGIPVHEMPASVDIVTRQQIQEQGYRTTTEAAQGAVGVLSGDLGGAPAVFSMRGFTGSAVNTLYNGIWIGPGDITSRIMETANLDQIEFLKGPSALMSGLDAIGGSVNFVSRQPHTGAIKSELDTSIDTQGTYRTHFGSGGSTLVPGLDYRFDVSSSKVNGFIDGVYDQLNNVSGQINYRVTDSLKVWGAVDYKRDDGHAYWGTPLTTTAFSGPFSTHGVVAGSATNVFTGDTLFPVTIDSRTIRTNYNVADNTIGAHELWVRGGFELKPIEDVTVKNQTYVYGAKRHWIDSETYAFNPTTSLVDRDRFFVTHKQQVIGNNTDVSWDSSFYGMENRLAAQLQVSRNDIQFGQEGGNTFPLDSVDPINPIPGFYGVMQPNIRNSTLENLAGSVEDRLKITPWFTLIGGIRIEDIRLTRDGINSADVTDPTSVPTIPAGLPFIKNWQPVSYRAAATFEPVKGLMIYGMYATAYDPAIANVFSVSPGNSLDLTSSRIYEAGVKAISADKRAEATIAVYDIERRNVFVALTNLITTEAGEVHSRGVEIAGAVRPIEGLKLWGNVAFTESTFGNFDIWTGNTVPNVAPVIINTGASYRFDNWRWPVEVGGTLRHVGQRFVSQDNLTMMLPYTTGDLYAFVDVPGRDLPWQGLDRMRFSFRVRNVTNALYAQFSDAGLNDSVILGAPRTFELGASARW
jgi:iron complex outermembrane receptor protein